MPRKGSEDPDQSGGTLDRAWPGLLTGRASTLAYKLCKSRTDGSPPDRNVPFSRGVQFRRPGSHQSRHFSFEPWLGSEVPAVLSTGVGLSSRANTLETCDASPGVAPQQSWAGVVSGFCA